MLHSMTIRLIHVHQLNILYLCCGLYFNLGSFGVTGVKRSFSLKMLLFVHVTQHEHKTHTSSSALDPLPMLWGQMSIWGHLGSQGSRGHFHSKCYNSSMLHSMTIWLIHVHQLETLFLCYGVKCQTGVVWGLWGQNVIFTKNAITRPCYRAWPWDLYRLISLRRSTYVRGSNVNLGSFGGHWNQKVIFI